MSEELEDYIGELMVVRPQMFEWKAQDGVTAFISVNHVVGYQIVDEIDSDEAHVDRTLFVTCQAAETLWTQDQDQIERFLDLWDIV